MQIHALFLRAGGFSLAFAWSAVSFLDYKKIANSYKIQASF
jgi:hypothetical protein